MKLLILLAWHYERLVRCGLSFGRLHPRSPDPVGACDGLRKLILETYNFKPSKLSAAEQAEKRAWKMVESQAASQLPCLREALNEPKMDAGFSLTEAVSCCRSIRRLPQNLLLAAIGAKLAHMALMEFSSLMYLDELEWVCTQGALTMAVNVTVPCVSSRYGRRLVVSAPLT